MKVQVTSIKSTEEFNIFEVEVLVGVDYYTFEVEIELCKVGEHYLQVASCGRYLSETLQYNAGAVGKIYKLVSKVYNGQEIEFPAIITEHLAINPLLAKREVVFA